MPADVSTEDGGGGRSAEDVSRVLFSHDGPGDQRADDVSSCSTLPDPSCSSAAHVAGGGCSAAAPLNTAKFPFHWDICPFTHHAKSVKVALECENAVALPVHLACLRRRDGGDGRGGRERRAVGSAGRGEAQLPKHLGSSEVRDENAMLFIANFVVDASCCSNLWWNPVRVAHDFASGSHSHMHFALGVPSRELALEVSDAFYDAMVRVEVVQAVDVSVPKQIVDVPWSTVQEVVLVCFFPWCLTKALVAPGTDRVGCTPLGRFVGLVVDSGHIASHAASTFHGFGCLTLSFVSFGRSRPHRAPDEDLYC